MLEDEYPVTSLCWAAGVSRSAYYKWKKSRYDISKREKENRSDYKDLHRADRRCNRRHCAQHVRS